ncbi:PREDICTED: calcitonin receptor [Myotis brandtii]|uniref:calcitonin receptor n=1 Tax=Myotis brandtii TaxID=109478 RepID=UPI0003BBEFCC|nr:PREDICTED: calcitonin receptor [Myotis brandtii]
MKGNKKSTSKVTMRIPYSTRWCLIFFIFMNFPTLLSSVESKITAPKAEDSFLVRLGKWKMRVAEAKCLHRMEKLPPYQGEGLYCDRMWDGWLCWDDTPAGKTVTKQCPDYFPDFDTTEVAVKHCEINGTWELTADMNETLTNYSMCYAFSDEKMKHAYMMFYVAVVGHSVSLLTLTSSLGVFLRFRNLACQRVTMHKHMFLTYILNSIGVLVHLTQVVPKIEYVNSDPLSCKILNCINHYLMLCNYFWMLCEGIYLHKLLVVNVFNGEQNMKWYYLLGWGFPVVPTITHAIARLKHFNDSCWMSVETYLVYIIHGPIMAALTVNFFFLLNILRVLVKKIKNDRQHDGRRYLKAVKATLFLVPLLGIQFVILPWRPHTKIPARVYDYVMHFLSHFQGFFVSMIYCFYNTTVQEALTRRLQLCKIRWEQRNGYANRRQKYNIMLAALAAAAAATNADPGDIPVCICHRDPRNHAAANNLEGNNNDVPYEVEAEVNLGEEIHEIIPLEILEQESCA